MLALVSAMFTVAWIQRHNEMTALMAAGVSRIRVLVPIIVAVAVVSLLSAANRELVIPRYRNELSRRPQDPLGDQPQGLKPCYDNQTDVVLGGKSTFADQKRIEEPNFLICRRRCGNTATNWSPTTPITCRPKGTARADTCSTACASRRTSTPARRCSCDGEAVLITPHDAPDWLKPDQCFLRSDVDFDQLTDDGDRPSSSSPRRRS